MQFRGIGLLSIAALLMLASAGSAQFQPPSQSLKITAKNASTWTSAAADVVQLDGPCTIELDRAKLSADRAVVWIQDAMGGQPGDKNVTIALLGSAKTEQPGVIRTDRQLLVNAQVNGPIQINAETTTAQDQSRSQTYLDALALRQSSTAIVPTTRPLLLPTSNPTTGPARHAVRPKQRIPFQFDHVQTTNVEGKIAAVLSGNVAIATQQPDGQYIQMQAQRAVVFTTRESLRDGGKMPDFRSIEDLVTSAYLEGDVRVSVLPAQGTQAEVRLQAERVYYDFTTDRAVLTDAIIHTQDLQRAIPIVVRAKLVRQLSEGEYRAEKAEITTSSFAVPSYSIRADKAYVRQEPTETDGYGNRTTVVANSVTFNSFGTPVFYLPAVGGSFTERGFPLRGLQVGNSNIFGTFVESEWGLFETLGKTPPRDLDLSFHADYYSDRGPGTGLDGKYGGGWISPTSREPYSYEGDFKSYFVWDHGEDDLGRKRARVIPPEEFRGMIDWHHQSFLPNDWQLQLQGAWISDATFMQQWYEHDFNNGLPMETSLYLKRQRDTEAITLLATIQPNNFVTTADLLQEQFEIERLPQLGYQRIGDSFAEDKLTFFSNNAIERVRFNVSGTDLGDQGFRFNNNVIPGQPALGLVGVSAQAAPPDVTQDWNNRADLRQEVDYPVQLGKVKMVPYVVGRYTGYTDSPGGGAENRFFAGAGVRFNTQFWKVDNNAYSDLFDIHRVRHIVEPEVHLWTGVENVEPGDLYIYDEPVDKIYDYSAVQLALRQRWQTKRGGPGNWRNVDFFTFNVEVNLFANQPPEDQLQPVGFRGQFFSTLPETSIPRNSVNADAGWRVSDTTLLLADAQYNMDEQILATTSVGLAAQRGDRITYFLGLRYIDELDSSIGTAALSYQLTPKYTIGLRESVDFGDDSNVYSSITVSRKFDRFFTMLSIYTNADSGESGFSFALYPEGLGAGASTDALSRAFGGKQ